MKLCPKCGKQFADDANFCPVDAARLNAIEVVPTAIEPGGDPFNARFEMQARLGGATTGRIDRALDRETNQVVAIKLIAPEVAGLPSIAAKLERELRQLERVNSPGIARVLASGKKGDQYWVATEYLDGAQTLGQAIRARGPIDVASAGKLIEMIGEALIEAAKAGVVHRDLSPKNVLFSGDQVKLINFCIPTAGPGSDTAPGVAEYVAPECVEGKPLDQRSNIYSLGAIHYFVLTGQPPIDGDQASVFRAKVEGTIPPPSMRGLPIPPEVDVLVKRALDRSPSKRYLTVRQYLDEIVRVAEGPAPTADAAPAKPAPRPRPEDLVRTLTGLASVGAPIGSGPVFPLPGQPAGQSAGPSQLAGQSAGQPTFGAAPVPEQNSAVPSPIPSATMPMGARPIDDSDDGLTVPFSPIEQAEFPAAAVNAAAPVVLPIAPAMPQVTDPVSAGLDATAPAPVISTPPLVAPAPAVIPAPAAPVNPILSSPAALAAAAAASGKKKAEDESGKGKFRETLWFKKGELDVVAAEAAAAERARTGKDGGTDKADSRPMDERYNDDGTISHADRDKYSLKTGGTQMMMAMTGTNPASSTGVSENELIDEMKGGRRWILALIAGGLLLLIIVIVVLAR